MPRYELQGLLMIVLCWAVIGYLWYQMKKMGIPFQKKWYPWAAIILAFFFPFWSLVAAALCLLRSVKVKLAEIKAQSGYLLKE